MLKRKLTTLSFCFFSFFIFNTICYVPTSWAWCDLYNEDNAIDPTSFLLESDDVNGVGIICLSFPITNQNTNFNITLYQYASSFDPSLIRFNTPDSAESIVVEPTSAEYPEAPYGREYTWLLPAGYYTLSLYMGDIDVWSYTYTIVGNTGTTDPCAKIKLDPSSFNATWTGNSDSFFVISAPNCQWASQSDSDWVSISNGMNGSGFGKVSFTVHQNESRKQRSGAISVGNNIFNIEQKQKPYLPFFPLLMNDQ